LSFGLRLHMPIYDFQCSECGYQQELMRKVSAPSVDTCPQCQKETFSKKVSAPNFQLSGSGWYATDFKGGSNSSASKAAEPASTEGAKCAAGCACH
jgi:putative FmdB family regulatory protein